MWVQDDTDPISICSTVLWIESLVFQNGTDEVRREGEREREKEREREREREKEKKRKE
jgi:hypothetical protein